MARRVTTVMGWALAAIVSAQAALAVEAAEEASSAPSTAADQDSAQALFEAGVALLQDGGTPRDPARALLRLRAAAEQGHAAAQARLGMLYENGDGVAADPVQAVAWYRKAAEQGDANGQYQLGLAYVTGTGVAHDDDIGARWIRSAADQDLAMAQSALAMLHEFGRGVPPDSLLARDWFRRAALGKHARSAARLKDYACLDTDSCTQEHGVGLTYATRATFRDALKRHGAIVNREDTVYISDLYVGGDATSARSFRVGYFDGRLFEIAYAYDDQATFLRALEALGSRFGKPEVDEGAFSGKGDSDRRWLAPDGVVVHAHRCDGCSSSEIRFEVPAVKSAYDAWKVRQKEEESPAPFEPEGTTGPERVERSERRIAQVVVRGRPTNLLGEPELRRETCDHGIPIQAATLRAMDAPDWAFHLAPRADGSYDVTLALRDGEADPLLVFHEVQPGQPQTANLPNWIIGGGPPERVELALGFSDEPPCIRILQVKQLAVDIAKRLAAVADLDIQGLELLTDPTPLTFNFDAVSAHEILSIITDMSGLALKQVGPRAFVVSAAGDGAH